ncbi:hypothetical protein [Lacticaseibacillus kribbianus]|uniref:hypothetical protein n=1 Tax=Lacticaseibacillus kribbianus TaxID=2926292 RepID=UPI001CD52EED|nr:hypothetical protein [Lacticaseibacillus kribbianus]
MRQSLRTTSAAGIAGCASLYLAILFTGHYGPVPYLAWWLVGGGLLPACALWWLAASARRGRWHGGLAVLAGLAALLAGLAVLATATYALIGYGMNRPF